MSPEPADQTKGIIAEILANKEVPAHISFFLCKVFNRLKVYSAVEAYTALTDIVCETRNATMRKKALDYRAVMKTTSGLAELQ